MINIKITKTMGVDSRHTEKKISSLNNNNGNLTKIIFSLFEMHFLTDMSEM